MKAIMTSRQAAELDHAFERNGWTAEDVKWLSEGRNLLPLLCVRHGIRKTVLIKHDVCLDVLSELPFEGAQIEKHEGVGVVTIELRGDDHLYVEGVKIELFQSNKQKKTTVQGWQINKEIERQNGLLNFNIMNYLLKHPELIPEHWKKDKDNNPIRIFFWGSTFRTRVESHLTIPFLFHRSDGTSGTESRWLQHNWNRNDYAAIARNLIF